MSFEVQLTADAVRDLEDIYRYKDRHRSPAEADHVLEPDRTGVQQPVRASQSRTLPKGTA